MSQSTMPKRPHHRTYYRGPTTTRRTVRRTGVWIGVAALAVAAATGITAAAFTLGVFSIAPSQSAASVNPAPPAGVSYVSTYANTAGNLIPSGTGKCTANDTSNKTSHDALASNLTFFVCLNSVAVTGYGATDVVWQATISWSTVVPINHTYELSITLGEGASGSISKKAFVATPATALTGPASALIAFDMTSSGVGAISGLTVIVSDCGTSGAGCP